MKQAFDILNPFLYPWMAFNIFLSYYFLALCVKAFHERSAFCRQRFAALDDAQKRNVVTYIFELIATTIIFFLQVYAGWDVLFQWKDSTSLNRLNVAMAIAILTVSLYLWEMMYRIKMGLPLLIHHIATIVGIQLNTVFLYQSEFQSMAILRLGFIMVFYATTEQVVFLALYIYRMKMFPKLQSRLFYAAALQSLIVKTMVTLFSLFYCTILWRTRELWNEGAWGAGLTITYPMLILCLFGSQCYSTKILLLLAARCHGNKDGKDEAPSLSLESEEEVRDKELEFDVANREDFV